MVNYKKMTGFFIIGLFILIGAWDIFVFTQGGTDATISNVMTEWSYAFPAMTFTIGFIMGHLFWRKRPSTKEKQAIIDEYLEGLKKLESPEG